MWLFTVLSAVNVITLYCVYFYSSIWNLHWRKIIFLLLLLNFKWWYYIKTASFALTEQQKSPFIEIMILPFTARQCIVSVWCRLIDLNGLLYVVNVSLGLRYSQMWMRCDLIVAAFQAHFTPHIPQTHTHIQFDSASLPTFTVCPIFTVCLCPFKSKLPQCSIVIGYLKQFRSLMPDFYPVIRSTMRWKPWWGSMGWTHSRCSWPTKTWWCWETLSSTRRCRRARISGPSHASTLRTASWWQRWKPTTHQITTYVCLLD